MGGAGALAFKAGLVALVGTLAYQVGSAIGNVIFQTEKMEKKFKDAAEASARAFQDTQKLLSQNFSEQIEDIELIRDPEAKSASYKEMLETLNKNMSGTEAKLMSSKRAVVEWNDAWQITGERKKYAEMAKTQMEEEQKNLDRMKEERAQLEKILGPRAAENALIKQKNEEAAKNEQYIASLQKELELLKAKGDAVAEVTAKQNAIGEAAQGQAADLLRQIEAEKALAEAEKKRVADDERAKEKEKARLDNLEQLKTRELANLEKQRLALTQSAEAAQAFALVQQGLDEATAKQIASEQALIDAQKVAADQARKDAEQKQADIQRIADLKQDELDKLKQEKILLEQGEAAAYAFGLTLKGIDEASAKQIAAERERLAIQKKEAEEAKKKGGASASTTLTALESRTLSRGQVNTTEKILQEQVALQKQLVDELRSQGRTRIRFQGVGA
jgi:dTMP kinase